MSLLLVILLLLLLSLSNRMREPNRQELDRHEPPPLSHATPPLSHLHAPQYLAILRESSMWIAIAGSEAQPPFGDPPGDLKNQLLFFCDRRDSQSIHHREHHPPRRPPQRQIDLNCNALLGEPCAQVQVYFPKAAWRSM
jgi:hypothetical protein